MFWFGSNTHSPKEQVVVSLQQISVVTSHVNKLLRQELQFCVTSKSQYGVVLLGLHVLEVGWQVLPNPLLIQATEKQAPGLGTQHKSTGPQNPPIGTHCFGMQFPEPSQDCVAGSQ